MKPICHLYCEVYIFFRPKKYVFGIYKIICHCQTYPSSCMHNFGYFLRHKDIHLLDAFFTRIKLLHFLWSMWIVKCIYFVRDSSKLCIFASWLHVPPKSLQATDPVILFYTVGPIPLLLLLKKWMDLWTNSKRWTLHLNKWYFTICWNLWNKIQNQ